MFEQSKRFFEEFRAIFEEGNPKRLEAMEKYTNNTAFTGFIVDEINGIIKAMQAEPQNEYFRIDASGYRSRWEELETIKGFRPHLWDLTVAVEHENDPKDWLDEVIKLAHVCCPLRVVIGYVPMKKRDEEQRLLDYAADALYRLHCRDNVVRGEFMVILGNSSTGRNKKNYFHYRAYVLDAADGHFVPL